LKEKEPISANILVLFFSIQDVIFCKSILSDFAAKTKDTPPTYSLDCVEGLEHMPLFISSVSFSGNIYTGEAARKKKDAEQRAARSAVISILGNFCFVVWDKNESSKTFLTSCMENS
jgi:hypothetical protein